MKLVADEGVDGAVVRRLREDGHNVFYVAEEAAGLSDEDVLARASAQGALLVTTDKDFGELLFRQRRHSAGVVLLRIAGLGALAKAELVSTAIRERGVEMSGGFSVITPGTVRIRAG